MSDQITVPSWVLTVVIAAVSSTFSYIKGTASSDSKLTEQVSTLEKKYDKMEYAVTRQTDKVVDLTVKVAELTATLNTSGVIEDKKKRGP